MRRVGLVVLFGLLSPTVWIVALDEAVASAVALPAKVGIDAVAETVRFLMAGGTWLSMTVMIGLAMRQWLHP